MTDFDNFIKDFNDYWSFEGCIMGVMRSIREKCAVFGVYGKGLDVSRLTFFGLYALQHRGQESSGIASTDGEIIYCHKHNGLVSQVFSCLLYTSDAADDLLCVD